MHSLVGLFYASLVSAIFHPWLTPYQQPQRGGPEPGLNHIRAGDLTPLFSVWTQVAARSIFERGEWPLWSDHIYCGEPFFAKPQIGVISLTTLLCVFLPAQVVATWTFLLHLWIAGMAMYAWCLVSGATLLVASSRLGEPCHSTCPANHLAAASGGAVFMLSGLMVEHTMLGHGPIVLVACWTPLVLLFLRRAFLGDRPVRSATFAGLLVAVQLLAGGETMFLYNAIAGGLLGLAWLICGGGQQSRCAAGRAENERAESEQTSGTPNLARRLLRVTVVGAVIGLVGFGLSAVKVLPGLELMPVSNRAGGLLLEDARGFIPEFREPAVLRVLTAGVGGLADRRRLFPITLFLAAVGLIAALRCRPLRLLALGVILLIVFGIAISHSQSVFGFLWHVLPMFRFQRIPQRALILAYLGLSLLTSVGAYRLLTLRMTRGLPSASSGPEPERTIARLSVRPLVGCALALAVCVESWIALPDLPPTADIRREVRENTILNHIADHDGRFRIHTMESTDRNWGVEHVTVPLGLSNLAGWDHLWLLEYFGAEGTAGRDVRPFMTAAYEAQHPARFWGMMSVRFVTATRPAHVPGLQLVSEFPVSRSSQPAKSAGPFLYENSLWMPRAWIVPHAILVLGDRAERLEAVYRLLDHPDFDPRRTVVIQSDRPAEISTETLSLYEAVVLPARWATGEVTRGLEQVQGRAITYTMQQIERSRVFLWSRPDDVDMLFVQLADEDAKQAERDSSSPDAGAIPEIEDYRSSRVRLGLLPQNGFLVLAEKFAHFPGWRAQSDAGPCELLRANGVASAIRLRGLEEWIELDYWPNGLARGIWITLVSVVFVPLIGWLGDRLLRV